MSDNLPGFTENIDDKLKTLLEKFNKKNKSRVSFLSVLFIIVFALVFFLIIFTYPKINEEVYLVLGISFIASALISYFIHVERKKAFAKKFKKSFFNEFFPHLMPDILYLNQKKIDSKIFNQANFFDDLFFLNMKANQVYADDYFTGKRGGTSFLLMDIRAFRVSRGRYSPSYKKTTSRIFDGLLIRCKLNFKGPIIKIYSKNAPYKSTKLNSKELKSITIKDEKIFNEEFELYIQEVDAVREIKGFRNFVSRLSGLRSLFDGSLYITFNNEYVYFGVSNNNNNFFDPNYGGNITLKQIRKIYEEILNSLVLVDFIDELNYGTPNPNLKQIER